MLLNLVLPRTVDLACCAPKLKSAHTRLSLTNASDFGLVAYRKVERCTEIYLISLLDKFVYKFNTNALLIANRYRMIKEYF